MTATPPALAARFAGHLAARGRLKGGETLVVALSGGVDSVALLHLLRFAPDLPPLTLVAAHVDHAMRSDSGDDAAWVRGLCRAWDVPVEVRRLTDAPTTEAQARVARYGVLEQIRAAHGAEWVVTAHHGDDQAETVLFRALRGTGLGGLQGIRERRAPAVWRPMLPFTRREIVSYAREARLTWREDPTNAHGFARNVIRHHILPLVEQEVAPGARPALRGLARRARADAAAWRSLEPELLARVEARRQGSGFSLDRGACQRLHPGVRARVIRALTRRLGVTLHDAGTHLAVEFTRSGAGGGRIPLGGGLWLRRELDRLWIVPGEVPPEDEFVTILGPGCGSAAALLGGRACAVAWRESGDVAAGAERFSAGHLAFPLRVRSWEAGDRIRLPYGSKKLKKLFLEARIPPGDRHRSAVLVDATGVVLWVPGVARSVDAPPSGDGHDILIHVTYADSD